jgi:transcriptional regulator with PAS, ATPase and Fis domain
MSHDASLKPADFPIQLVANKQLSQAYQQKSKNLSSESSPIDRIIEEMNNAKQKREDRASLLLKPWKIEERKSIEDALWKYKGNRGLTAHDLGISRSTLWRKMKIYHLV